MKVIHVITGLETGGAERALYNLLQGGLHSALECYVISLSNEGTIGASIKKLGVPVISLHMRSGRPHVAGILKYRRLIKSIQPDLIQGWMYHGNIFTLLGRFWAPKKTLIFWNIRQCLYQIETEKWLTAKVIQLNHYFSSIADTILYNSQLSKKQHEAFGFSSTNAKVIPNGIDIEKFHYSEQVRQEKRQKLGIPLNKKVVGHVARFHPMKDHETFIKAAVLLAEEHKDISFLLCGRNVTFDNPCFSQWIPTSLRSQFYLLGERTDIADLMSVMDIFCQSSWSEAFPNVLGEAMAVGRPCVATDVGDSHLIIGDSGILVPPKDINALKKGIETLLMLSPPDFQMLEQKAHNRIKENFSLKCIVQRYIDCYKFKIVSNKNGEEG